MRKASPTTKTWLLETRSMTQRLPLSAGPPHLSTAAPVTLTSFPFCSIRMVYGNGWSQETFGHEEPRYGSESVRITVRLSPALQNPQGVFGWFMQLRIFMSLEITTKGSYWYFLLFLNPFIKCHHDHSVSWAPSFTKARGWDELLKTQFTLFMP